MTLLLLALVSGSVWGQEVTVEQSVFTELNSKSLGGMLRSLMLRQKEGEQVILQLITMRFVCIRMLQVMVEVLLQYL